MASPPFEEPSFSLDSLIGATLDGRWVLESILGAGGMGAVFRARQLSVDRKVAVKVIRPDLSVDAVIVARFMREARVLSSLQHPNIVKLFEFGKDEEHGILFLVMELLQGKPLDAFLRTRRAPLTIDHILSIGIQLLSALSAAHEQGVVHRDLKPANILLKDEDSGDIRVVLVDFGIARKNIQDDPAGQLTATGQLHGTPKYMAPEQVRHKEITPKTDLYAVGLLLYRLISGEEVFAGESMFDVLLKQVHDPPPPLQTRWNLSTSPHSGLIDLIHTMLAKNPQDRPASALLAIDQLKAIQIDIHTQAAHSQPALRTRVQHGEHKARGRAPHSPAPKTRSPEWLNATRHDLETPPLPSSANLSLLLSMASLVLVLAALLGFGAWLYTKTSTETPETPSANAETSPEATAAPEPSTPPSPPKSVPKSDPTPIQPAPEETKPVPPKTPQDTHTPRSTSPTKRVPNKTKKTPARRRLDDMLKKMEDP